MARDIKENRVKNPEDRPLGLVLTLAAVIVIVLILTALCVGRYHVPVIQAVKILLSQIFPITPTWDKTMYDVIINLRLPRVLAAVLVGGSLALAGATYQGMFKNPLVSPDLLGVSAGACVGAAVAILMSLGSGMTQVLAFAGGLLTVFVTTSIPKLMHRNSTMMLVLAAVLIIMRWRINILSLGDNEARSLGVNLRFERGIAIICSTVLTASAVCMSGTIGWIGLVMPHLGRMVVGSNNVRLLPVTTLLSAAFLIIIDTLARTLTGGELPLGILTGFIGAPFFTWVLIKQRMGA